MNSSLQNYHEGFRFLSWLCARLTNAAVLEVLSQSFHSQSVPSNPYCSCSINNHHVAAGQYHPLHCDSEVIPSKFLAYFLNFFSVVMCSGMFPFCLRPGLLCRSPSHCSGPCTVQSRVVYVSQVSDLTQVNYEPRWSLSNGEVAA